MGRYLNPSNSLFESTVKYSKFYVDKTMLLEYTNQCLFGENKEICISRPRRFGKSITENMLVAYYSKGCNSRELFSKFKIAQMSDFERHLNKYNVIYVDIQKFLKKIKSKYGMLKSLQISIIKELKDLYSFINLVDLYSLDEYDLSDVLNDIFIKTQEKFIFIIDEWDCIFRKYEDNKVLQQEYVEFLCDLFKNQPYVALAYMTGILPIKKYGNQSELNMFKEYSMKNQKILAEFTGFTEDEVKNLCLRFGVSFEKTKQWYDGYNINGYSIYNPNSVMEAIVNNIFDNYWTKTETYEALRLYLVLNISGLKNIITKLIAGESVIIFEDTFKNDMCTLTTVEDVLMLLVHLGYLTYNFDTKEVRIPNKEISEEFVISIKESGYEPLIKLIEQSNKLLEYTIAKNPNKVAEILDNVHADNTSILQYNDENALSYVLKLAYYSAQTTYIFNRELKGGYGFADIVLIPRVGNINPAMIIELKWNKDVETALNQIKDKGYIKSLRDYHGKVLLVGINYDKKIKKHECLIEEIRI